METTNQKIHYYEHLQDVLKENNVIMVNSFQEEITKLEQLMDFCFDFENNLLNVL